MKIKYLVAPILIGFLAVSVSAQEVLDTQSEEPAAIAATPISIDITSPSDGATFDVGESISFQSNTTGGAGLNTYVWNFADGTNAGSANFTKSYSTAGSYRVTVTVGDFQNNTASDSINITVVDPAPVAPSTTLTVNGNRNTFTMAAGATATIAWSSTNADSCVASQAWTGAKGTSGSENIGPFSTAGDRAFGLVCTNSTTNLSAADTVVVTVTGSTNPGALDASITSPSNNSSFDINQSISFAASATGGTAPYTFVWNFGDGSANVTAQTTSKSFSASGSKTVTLTVTDATSATKTAAVAVTINTAGGGGGGGSTKPVISNIRVTDVTETTAIVRWDTDRAANSRVIFDTTSHPSISGASYPNFGYAFTSPLQDDSAKVTAHAVTLTGLTPNTTYYYRVLSQ